MHTTDATRPEQDRFFSFPDPVNEISARLVAAGVVVLGLATIVLGALVVAASLEAFLGLCLGCRAFALLMRIGVIPADVCARCNDLWGTAAEG